MRFDRELTLFKVRLLPRLRNTPQLPVLMYHSISPELSTRSPYYEINTSPEMFARQMSLLREHGYRPIDLSSGLRALQFGTLPSRAVAITFDDGYLDFHTHALPVLVEHGFTAIVYIVSTLTAAGSGKRLRLNGKECLTWPEVRELRKRGIAIGSHTETHPKLYEMEQFAIDGELRRSKATIENGLGEAIDSFAYPYAFPEQDLHFTAALKGNLIACGYQNSVSTIVGTAGRRHDPHFLPRIPVNSYDDDRLFLAKLQGAYDWIRQPQRLYKQAKSFFHRTNPATAS
jgi:peptidoglycan/xylan/chitin deacetylase (PgdA/CDA1 family)